MKCLIPLAACLLLASCSGPPAPSPSKATVMLTPTQARDRMSGLLDDTFSAILPTLHYRDGWPHAIENDRPKASANAYLDRYVMTKVAAAKYGALLGVIERRWREEGFTVETVNADARMPGISARAPDGSAIHLLIGYPGNITITAAVTPISAPDSTGIANLFGPEPPQPTLPNGNPDILPTYDDPFWSH